MAYYDDYLKVLPKVDADIVRSFIEENQEILTIKNLTEEEFKRLIDSVVSKESPVTQKVKLSPKIKAEEFNEFYSNLSLDLIHLFLEQNLIEGITENYDRIFEGNIQEVKNHLEKLKQRVSDLDMQREGEQGLVLESYNFDPVSEYQHIEKDQSSVSSQLWVDRDGSILEPVVTSRNFSHYFASLTKREEVNVLRNSKGELTATIEILEESPYVVENPSSNFGIENAISGEENRFWYSVALKPSNTLDSISINPKEQLDG